MKRLLSIGALLLGSLGDELGIPHFNRGKSIHPKLPTVLGDMIVSRQGKAAKCKFFGYADGSVSPCNLWPFDSMIGKYVVPIHIDRQANISENMLALMDWTFRYVERETNVVFLNWDDYPQIPDYVNITAAAHCSAMVSRLGGMQYLALNDDCPYRKTTLQLALYVLGLHHEHSREDRQLEVYEENIQPEAIPQVVPFPYLDLNNSPYDMASVTHFTRLSYSNNGQVAMDPWDPDFRTMLDTCRAVMSSCDLHAINTLYPGRRAAPRCFPNVIRDVAEPTSACLDKYDADKCNLSCYWHHGVLIDQGYCQFKGGAEFPPVYVDEWHGHPARDPDMLLHPLIINKQYYNTTVEQPSKNISYPDTKVDKWSPQCLQSVALALNADIKLTKEGGYSLVLRWLTPDGTIDNKRAPWLTNTFDFKTAYAVIMGTTDGNSIYESDDFQKCSAKYANLTGGSIVRVSDKESVIAIPWLNNKGEIVEKLPWVSKTLSFHDSSEKGTSGSRVHNKKLAKFLELLW